MKTCNQCKQEKELSDFNKNKEKKDGLALICKECNKKNLKSHYYRNKEYYFKKNKKKINEIRTLLKEAKDKCSKCGEDHPACLDFHHIDRSTKLHNLSTIHAYSKSVANVKIEMNKCIILCSNCHRKLHYEERQCSLV